MTQLVYYVAPWDRDKPDNPDWAPAPTDVHTLRHGYNLADLDMLARRALRRVWGMTTDYPTRYQLAWSAIACAIYAAPDDQPPQPGELIGAGQSAIARHVHDEMHHHGHDRRNGGTMRGFAAYWETPWRNMGSPEPAVVDRTALWQIWPALTDRQREALLALAALGTYQAAAVSLGVTYNTLKRHIEDGRRRFLVLWHEGEAPSRVWGSDRRVHRMGGARADVSYREAVKGIQRGRQAGRPGEKAEPVHGKVTTYNNHKCRCALCVEAKRVEGAERRARAGATVRRQMTVSQFADAVRRNRSGESWAVIAASLGFSGSYLRALRRGAAQPVPDPDAVAPGVDLRAVTA